MSTLTWNPEVQDCFAQYFHEALQCSTQYMPRTQAHLVGSHAEWGSVRRASTVGWLRVHRMDSWKPTQKSLNCLLVQQGESERKVTPVQATREQFPRERLLAPPKLPSALKRPVEPSSRGQNQTNEHTGCNALRARGMANCGRSRPPD